MMQNWAASKGKKLTKNKFISGQINFELGKFYGTLVLQNYVVEYQADLTVRAVGLV
jgi:hypothetical protein